MASGKKNQTAQELMAELQANPDWVRRNAEREAARAKQEAELSAEEAELVSDLIQAGLVVDSVWTLVNTKAPYPEAIPILKAHLSRDYTTRIHEGIVRALTVPEADTETATTLMNQLAAQFDSFSPSLRFALANALTAVATSDMIPELKKLLDNPKYKAVHRPLNEAVARARKRRPRT